MKRCPMCGGISPDTQMVCPKCGANITDVPIVHQMGTPAQQQRKPSQFTQDFPRQEFPRTEPRLQPERPLPSSTQFFQTQQLPPERPATQMSQPRRSPSYDATPQLSPSYADTKPFSWFDVCTVIGFVSSLVGLFWSSVLLLPLGLIMSLIGFRGNRTKAIAIAGIAIAIIGVIIKICYILTSQNILPEWFVHGIFG